MDYDNIMNMQHMYADMYFINIDLHDNYVLCFMHIKNLFQNWRFIWYFSL